MNILDNSNQVFKVKFNPFIPLIRLIWVTSTGVLLTGTLYLGFTLILTDTWNAILILLIAVPIIGFLFYTPLNGLLRNSKIYSISRDNLTVIDIVRFKKETVQKEMIRGFSDSEIEYRIGTSKQIIIYCADRRKFEIMQFEQFNFKNIKGAMVDKGYLYFGYEPYHWKFPDKRFYYYDKKKKIKKYRYKSRHFRLL